MSLGKILSLIGHLDIYFAYHRQRPSRPDSQGGRKEPARSTAEIAHFRHCPHLLVRHGYAGIRIP